MTDRLNPHSKEIVKNTVTKQNTNIYLKAITYDDAWIWYDQSQIQINRNKSIDSNLYFPSLLDLSLNITRPRLV